MVPQESLVSPLNNPIEIGTRIAVLLTIAYPRSLDLGRLVTFDYAMVHSADLGGPPSLHAAWSTREGELGLKRKLVEQSIQLLIRAGLVEVRVDGMGLSFAASEDAPGFVRLLESPLIHELLERARWLCSTLLDASDNDVRCSLRGAFSHWAEGLDPGHSDDVDRGEPQ